VFATLAAFMGCFYSVGSVVDRGAAGAITVDYRRFPHFVLCDNADNDGILRCLIEIGFVS
jgi:hypothetical protein